jgi:leader peptidase (prepilin peptidase)/N-methyltransferase
VLLASVLGAVIGLVFILVFRKGLAYELPFGTFLALAGILMVVWGHEAV